MLIQTVGILSPGDMGQAIWLKPDRLPTAARPNSLILMKLIWQLDIVRSGNHGISSNCCTKNTLSVWQARKD